jgi:hypothetical protein
MEDRIRINRTGERFSSHTQTHRHAPANRTPQDTGALRHQLIEATVAIIADGGDPRLGKSLALA